jgi:mannose-6-phosphate isomerase-like protein (cupin superfamily)
MKLLRSVFTIFLLAAGLCSQAQYLMRSFSSASETSIELSTPSAHYLPVFGEGDDSSSVIKGLIRFGNLNIDPSGKSRTARFSDEEQVIYILEGTGILNYSKEAIPVTKDDFIYIPAGKKFSFENPRESKLSVILMGFRIISGDTVKPSSEMMIAGAGEVVFQVLGSHGPTTTFQLLMGTTQSTRDRLAATCRVNSLFVMDFAAGGTNIPHRHDNEEEIYFVLRGKGDIVAGETSDGKEFRHPSAAGDAWFFSPKTLIGFYSGNTEGEEHPGRTDHLLFSEKESIACLRTSAEWERESISAGVRGLVIILVIPLSDKMQGTLRQTSFIPNSPFSIADTVSTLFCLRRIEAVIFTSASPTAK